MSYLRTTWQDRAVQYPLTYTQAAGVVGGTTTFSPAPGLVTQAGTPQNANNLNNMEAGILKAAIFGTIYAYKNLGGGL